MRLLIIIFLCLYANLIWAQTDSGTIRKSNSIDSVGKDSLFKDSTGTIAPRKDSIVPVVKRLKTWKDDSLFFKLFSGKLISSSKSPVFYQVSAEKKPQSKDEIFYVLMGALFILGLIRSLFPKYLPHVFRLFAQSSFRQKQTRDQLLQGALPSMLINLFFVAITALFIAAAANYFMVIDLPFWTLFLYAAAGIIIIYIVKYLFLRFAGWVFNVREAADTYIFIVFLINKVLGLILLPLLILFAFSGPVTVNVIATISVSIVVLLFIYRYIIAFSNVRGILRVNAIHFFIYLCAVELAPILVIYKLLMSKIGGSI